MTLPPAALPGHAYPAAPVEHVPQPGAEQPLGCPNCRGTQLTATYTVRTACPVTVHHRPAASAVEVEPAGEPLADRPGNWQQPVKVECDGCRWSYEGPHPLGKLVAQ